MKPLHPVSVRSILLIFSLVFLSVQTAYASDEVITRREGFLLLWSGIKRPVEETRETPFTDVQEGDIGYEILTFAKRRGFFDDDETFYPDEPLRMRDALLWLYRTRNVDELPDMTPAHVPDFLEKYPIAPPEAAIDNSSLSLDELAGLAQELDRLLKEEVHEVSLYSEKFHGKGTAFGETFNMHEFTAAHRSFPHNTLVRVTNIANNKSIIVRINDRGPYVEGRNMDLSLASFLQIEDRAKGILNATFERLGDPSLVSRCGIEQDFEMRISHRVHFLDGFPDKLVLGDPLSLAANTYFVLRGITYPDGTFTRYQDFIGPEERYFFAPDQLGEYTFLFGTAAGKQKSFTTRIVNCDETGTLTSE